MRFEWDEEKAASNLRNHGVDFELAKEVFEHPLTTYYQDRFVDGEERWSAWELPGATFCLLHSPPMEKETKNLSGSSLQEGRIVRSEDIPEEERERRIAESIKRLDAMTDEDIDYSDIPPIRNFPEGEHGKFYRPVKDQVTLRLDRYVLNWFRLNHDKYQTAINAALIEHIRRERAAAAKAEAEADEQAPTPESTGRTPGQSPAR